MMTGISKHVAAGLLFISIGLVYGTISMFALSMGSMLEMGPGYFPMALSVILVVLGAVGAVQGNSDTVGKIPLRGMLTIAAAILFFGLFVRSLGLFAVVVVTSFVSSVATNEWRALQSAVSALLLATFSSALFVYFLGLPVPIFGPLLTNW